MSRCIFISNDFLPSQFLFIISFINGYAKQANKTKLIFQSPLPESVLISEHVHKILKKYEVVFLHTSLSDAWRNPRLLIKILFSYRLIDAVLYGLRCSRKNLLDKDLSWYQCQIYHAIWDTALRDCTDGTIDLSRFELARSSLRIHFAIAVAAATLEEFSFDTYIVGHTVYSRRAQIAYLRDCGVELIAHASNVLYRLPKSYDAGWSILKKISYDSFRYNEIKEEVDIYWQKILCGESMYADAKNAANSKKRVEEDVPYNIVFLHIFRDSPFNMLDRSRAFADYIHWIMETLAVISNSNERWLIKLHPSAERWGENQDIWLSSIMRYLFGYDYPSNILIDPSSYSNIDLLKHSRRVVTYRGSVHLEAACLGIKPITIVDTTLFNYDSRLVHKPLSVSEYKSLLLCSSSSDIFKLTTRDMQISQYVLYCRDVLFTFRNDIRSFHLYKSDKLSAFQKEFASVSGAHSTFCDFLGDIGTRMASGENRSFSKYAYSLLT